MKFRGYIRWCDLFALLCGTVHPNFLECGIAAQELVLVTVVHSPDGVILTVLRDNHNEPAKVLHIGSKLEGTLRSALFPINIRRWQAGHRFVLQSHRSSDSYGFPVGAEYLFYLFLDSTTCDGLVGDLNERYEVIIRKFGKFRADLWCWKEAFRSVGPVAWGWFKKLVMKPAIALGSWMVGHGLLKDGSALEFVKSLLAECLKRMRG
jgi:hypothetical protein